MNNKLKNKKITFLGVTFKPNTDDMREASSIPMISYLNKKNSKINYYDPSGEKIEFKNLKNVKFSKSITSACHNADLIILHTIKLSKLLFDDFIFSTSRPISVSLSATCCKLALVDK